MRAVATESKTGKRGSYLTCVAWGSDRGKGAREAGARFFLTSVRGHDWHASYLSVHCNTGRCTRSRLDDPDLRESSSCPFELTVMLTKSHKIYKHQTACTCSQGKTRESSQLTLREHEALYLLASDVNHSPTPALWHLSFQLHSASAC